MKAILIHPTTLFKKKGQVSIYGLLIVFVMLVIFVALLPAILTAIDTIQNSSADPLTKLLASTLPTVMIASILLVLLVYSGGR